MFTDVQSAPFGWTKSFNVKVKGHPLAEHAKEITTNTPNVNEENDSKTEPAALKMENTLKSSWYMMEPNGNLTSLEKYTFMNEHTGIKMLFNHEVTRSRVVDQVPPHVRLMKKLGIADYESVSDSGNMRFYPKGKLMKSLIELYVTQKVIEYGAVEVETPIMYDSNYPAMQSYFHRFPARQYNIRSDNKQLFLRFAACFGQFLMAKDFLMSYKNLPVKLYELTRYSFRREKSGELVGLRRLRAFSMPDCHAFCKDIDQAKNEFMKRFDLSMRVLQELGLSLHDDIEMALRLTKGFYDENLEFIKQIIHKFNKPGTCWKFGMSVFFILSLSGNFTLSIIWAKLLLCRPTRWMLKMQRDMELISLMRMVRKNIQLYYIIHQAELLRELSMPYSKRQPKNRHKADCLTFHFG